MIIVRSPLARIVASVVSLAVTAVVYFAIVQPAMDDAERDANQTIENVQETIRESNRSAEQTRQDVQRQVDQAQRQTDEALRDAEKANPAAKPAVDEAQKRLDCVQAAGTDVEKLAAC